MSEVIPWYRTFFHPLKCSWGKWSVSEEPYEIRDWSSWSGCFQTWEVVDQRRTCIVCADFKIRCRRTKMVKYI